MALCTNFDEKTPAFCMEMDRFLIVKYSFCVTQTMYTYNHYLLCQDEHTRLGKCELRKGFYSACTACLAIIKLATPQAGKQCNSSVPTQTVARMQTISPKCNSQIALHAPCTQFGPCHKTWAEQVSETTRRMCAILYGMYQLYIWYGTCIFYGKSE